MLKAIWKSIREFKLAKEVAEPIRRVANVVSGWAVALGAVVALGQQHIDLVPAKYRDQVSVAIASAGVVIAFVTKVTAEVMRNKVFSPATHEAELKDAAEASYRTQVQQGTVVDPAMHKANVPPPPPAAVDVPPPPAYIPPPAPIPVDSFPKADDTFWDSKPGDRDDVAFPAVGNDGYLVP